MSRAEDLKKIKLALQERKQKLTNALSSEMKSLGGGVTVSSGDISEAAQLSEIEEMTASIADSEGGELEAVIDALKRFEAKTYGICEDCDKKIPVARLKVVPHASRCVNCQASFEQENGFEGQPPSWRVA